MVAVENLQRKVPNDVTIAEFNDGDQASTGQLTPPNNRYAEQALLGSILIDNNQFEKIAGYLSQEDFYQQRHQVIFAAIVRLFKNSENVDLVTMRTALDQTDDLGNAGGVEYLLELANETPYAGNTESYAKIIRECSVLRQLLAGTRQIQHLVYNAGESPAAEVLSKSQHLIYQIDQEGRSNTGLLHVKQSAGEAFNKIEELFNSPRSSHITGIETGFIALDHITSGFQRSDLIIIAGRPSMGKTALALNVAEHAAIKGKLRVAIFSLEMSSLSLAMRSLSSLSSIDSKRIREGEFGTGDQADVNWRRLGTAYDMLNDAEIYIDDTSGISPLEISARSRRMARETGGLDMIIVDYLQLLQMQSKDINRVTEIANITRELKFLAKELDIPVVVLSQLSRAAENRTRPKMADLRDSGAIEQDADVILFIYRDEVYNSDSKDKGQAEIIVAKHRNGETGTIKLMFMKECTRFENPALGEYDDI